MKDKIEYFLAEMKPLLEAIEKEGDKAQPMPYYIAEKIAKIKQVCKILVLE